ncbi:MAG: DsbA family protein [Actinomycetota bacterium]
MSSDRVLVDLSAPATDRDHVRGSLDAPVVIVEYGDYECPDCGRAYWVVKELLDELSLDVAFVFRNFPLPGTHPRAESVAEALEAAGGQGRFWEIHDWFYEHQHQLEVLDLEEHVRIMGLDVDAWRTDMRDRVYRERVIQDVRTGRASGVTGTPTFFINGVRYNGDLDRASLLAAIERHGALEKDRV